MVTGGGTVKPSGCFTRRKITILFISLCVCTFLGYVLREKYFYRADVLVAISSQVDSTTTVETKGGGVLSFFGLGGGKKEKTGGDGGAVKMNVWDAWMKSQPHYTSIGDIYNKCDNKTRVKIGKVVLQPKDNGEEGVQIRSYMNSTFEHDITSSKTKMEVFYNDELLYTKNNDMCEMAKFLDTPYSCPIKAGHTLVIQDVAKLPSYIPKGKYRVTSIVYDQKSDEIGCTYIDFKTGETT